MWSTEFIERKNVVYLGHTEHFAVKKSGIWLKTIAGALSVCCVNMAKPDKGFDGRVSGGGVSRSVNQVFCLPVTNNMPGGRTRGASMSLYYTSRTHQQSTIF